MRILTITCHDVYNAGASLQAYALMSYLNEQGHDTRIIDYKPDYLSRHFKLFSVNNPKFRSNFFVRFAYIASKMPGKIISLPKKRLFDQFNGKYLLLSKRYHTNGELKLNSPVADLYFAGSDQIWNPLFPNGRDPAFFLDFAPETAVKASYAASFGTDSIPKEYREQMARWMKRLDYVSVRELSGVEIVKELGVVYAQVVVDPVFLKSQKFWKLFSDNSKYAAKPRQKYILVYNFGKNAKIATFIQLLAEERNAKIYSFTRCKALHIDKLVYYSSPMDFVALIRNAECIISNSFHATAFSVIFEKDFYVFSRKENINARMQDLLSMLDLSDRWICPGNGASDAPIPYSEVRKKLEYHIEKSKEYIEKVLEAAK